MQELLVQVLGYVWGVWRYRWVTLVLALVISLGGWLWVFQLPEQYVASARVYVDSNTVLRPLLRGLAIQPNINQRIRLMSRTLLSRPNLEKLMRMTDLDLHIKNDAQKEKIMEMLKKHISLSGVRSNNSLYSVRFQHEDREMAKKVVQSLITVFIESTLGGERADSADAQSFLDQQIGDYEERLIESESRLAKFKQKYVGILPGQSGGYYSRLSKAKGQLSSASLELNETKQRRAELRRQLAGEDPIFLLSDDGSGAIRTPLDGRIRGLQSRLDNLLTRYTDKYPEVVHIKSLMADLEVEKKEQIEQLKAGKIEDFSGLQRSPVYQQMRTMLAETEARAAELAVRVGEYKLRVQSLEDLVENIPIIEAELKQLNRDYEVVQQQHGELLERRESAHISQDVEQKANDLVFRVIDPPFVPQKPNEPNKLLLNSVVLAAGLGFGGAIALLLSLIYPVIIDRQSLGHVTGLPVLGGVMWIPSAQEKKRALIKRLQFFALVLLLLLLFVATNIAHWWLIS